MGLHHELAAELISMAEVELEHVRYRELGQKVMNIRDIPVRQGNISKIGYPLLTRAWVFQERLLSPRVLHFGNTPSWLGNVGARFGPRASSFKRIAMNAATFL